MLDPLDLRADGARLDGHAHDDLVLDDEARDGLLHCRGLHGNEADEQRDEAEKCHRIHCLPRPRPQRLRSEALNNQ
jgi:hypothetical protein